MSTCYLVMRSYQHTDVTSSESPYAEVRAAVSNIDDPSMPVNTFRMYVAHLHITASKLTSSFRWFLGIILTILMAGINHFFAERCMHAFSPYLCLADEGIQTLPLLLVPS